MWASSSGWVTGCKDVTPQKLPGMPASSLTTNTGEWSWLCSRNSDPGWTRSFRTSSYRFPLQAALPTLISVYSMCLVQANFFPSALQTRITPLPLRSLSFSPVTCCVHHTLTFDLGFSLYHTATLSCLFFLSLLPQRSINPHVISPLSALCTSGSPGKCFGNI